MIHLLKLSESDFKITMTEMFEDTKEKNEQTALRDQELSTEYIKMVEISYYIKE